MAHTPIHTKYHKLFGARILLDINGRCAPERIMRTSVDIDFIREMVNECSKLPRYVIQPELLSSMVKESTMKSLAAMIEHQKSHHLPFKQVLVEFEEEADLDSDNERSRRTKVRHFVWLSETNLMPANIVSRDPITEKFTALCWTLIDDIPEPALTITPLCATCSLISDEYARKNNIPAKGIGSGTLVRAVLGPQIIKGSISKEFEDRLVTAEGVSHAFGPVNDALCAMVLLLHTKGVVADRIEVPAKFNKSRTASGKPIIQDHTVLRIGHVYNRSGDQIKFVPGQSGRTMPVHWRAGHWRNQRFGEKLSKARMTWIDPMLINYVEGDAPIPKPKEVTI